MNYSQEGTERIGAPIRGGIVSSGFAWRGGIFHMGVDIVASPTAQDWRVYSVHEGVVASVSVGCVEGNMGCGGGYGNYVTINHQNGFFTRYAHLQGVSVKIGQRVRKGQIIGLAGNTGQSSGRHLHYEVLRANVFYAQSPSSFLNPQPFLDGTMLFPRSVRASRWRKVWRDIGISLLALLTLAGIAWAAMGFKPIKLGKKKTLPPPDANGGGMDDFPLPPPQNAQAQNVAPTTAA